MLHGNFKNKHHHSLSSVSHIQMAHEFLVKESIFKYFYFTVLLSFDVLILLFSILFRSGCRYQKGDDSSGIATNVLNEQAELEAESNAVLGRSDEKTCTYAEVVV